MRIKVTDGGRHINVPVPTMLVFSKVSAWLANRFGRKYAGDDMKDIPPEALDKLFAEFRRIKRRHKQWALLEVHSADGADIEITL